MSNDLNTGKKYLSGIVKARRNKNLTHTSIVSTSAIPHAKLQEYPVYRDDNITNLSKACAYAVFQIFEIAYKSETSVTALFILLSHSKSGKNSENLTTNRRGYFSK